MLVAQVCWRKSVTVKRSKGDVNKITYTTSGKIGRALCGGGRHEGAKSDNDGLHLGVDIVKNSNWSSVDGDVAVSQRR